MVSRWIDIIESTEEFNLYRVIYYVATMQCEQYDDISSYIGSNIRNILQRKFYSLWHYMAGISRYGKTVIPNTWRYFLVLIFCSVSKERLHRNFRDNYLKHHFFCYRFFDKFNINDCLIKISNNAPICLVNFLIFSYWISHWNSIKIRILEIKIKRRIKISSSHYTFAREILISPKKFPFIILQYRLYFRNSRCINALILKQYFSTFVLKKMNRNTLYLVMLSVILEIKSTPYFVMVVNIADEHFGISN